MPQIEEGFKEIAYKLAIYVPGVILGLSAKLSKINRNKKLTWKEAIFQTSVAFSAAWVIWFVLDYTGHPGWAGPASVVCGRFGDEIIIWFWSFIKKVFRTALEQIK